VPVPTDSKATGADIVTAVWTERRERLQERYVTYVLNSVTCMIVAGRRSGHNHCINACNIKRNDEDKVICKSLIERTNYCSYYRK
jgi:hypothetical protein